MTIGTDELERILDAVAVFERYDDLGLILFVVGSHRVDRPRA
ncbi:MAG: hypothetical protein V5A46_10705 [Haloferacaceae archaeon]